MKLIFIHGAPAVGKFTVAQKLAKLTGYKLFHNHLTLDLADSFFSSKNPNFWEFVEKIRLGCFEFAAKKGIKGMIFTFGDLSSNNFGFPRKVVAKLKKYNSKVFFVNLVCREEELFKRVSSSSRKKFNKTTSVYKLKKSLKTWNFNKKVPFAPTLEIDNTKLSPLVVAKKIKGYFSL